MVESTFTQAQYCTQSHERHQSAPQSAPLELLTTLSLQVLVLWLKK